MHSWPVKRPHPGLRVLALLTSMLLALLLTAPEAVAAPDGSRVPGLGFTNDARFVVDLAAGKVTVTETVTLTNRAASSGGGYYYWNRWGFLAPASATKIAATSNGQRLSVQKQATRDDGVTQVITSFAPLHYGRSRTLTLSYVLNTAAFRSDDPVRVGKGFASFPVFVDADPGKLKIAIVGPADAELVPSEDFTSTVDDDVATWRATNIHKSGGYYAQVAVSLPAAGAKRKVDIGGRTIDVVAFPGDKKWLDFTADNLPKVVAALEDIAGSPLPDTVDTVSESVNLTAAGWGGVYDGYWSEISLAEDLDLETLAHELAHAWQNSSNSAERWISEGLAEDLAQRTLSRLGEESDARTVKRTSKDAVPLEEWDYPDATATAEDDYGYPASAQTIKALFKGLSDAEYAAVVTAISNGESPYGTAGRTGLRESVTWRSLLDFIETAAPGVATSDAEGVTPAAKVMTSWVLKDAKSPKWAERQHARTAYQALNITDGAWTPPAGVRDELTSWSFAKAEELMSPFGPTAERALRVQRLAAAGDVGIAEVKSRYERAQSPEQIAALGPALASAENALTALGQAKTVAGLPSPLAGSARLLLGVDAAMNTATAELDQGDPGDAEAAAADARLRAAFVVPVGSALLVAGLAIVLATLLLARAVGRRRAPRTPAPLAVAGDVPTADTPTADAQADGAQPAAEAAVTEPPAAKDLPPDGVTAGPDPMPDSESVREVDAAGLVGDVDHEDAQLSGLDHLDPGPEAQEDADRAT